MNKEKYDELESKLPKSFIDNIDFLNDTEGTLEELGTDRLILSDIWTDIQSNIQEIIRDLKYEDRQLRVEFKEYSTLIIDEVLEEIGDVIYDKYEPTFKEMIAAVKEE